MMWRRQRMSVRRGCSNRAVRSPSSKCRSLRRGLGAHELKGEDEPSSVDLAVGRNHRPRIPTSGSLDWKVAIVP
jgi:hypothetical protein